MELFRTVFVEDKLEIEKWLFWFFWFFSRGVGGVTRWRDFRGEEGRAFIAIDLRFI